MKQFFVIFVLLLSALGSRGQDPGFFLDGWTPKIFSPPAFRNEAKPSAPVTVTVTVDTSVVLNKVSPYLFGNNCNPYMTQMVTEGSLISQIKTLSPNIIRMPGGNISSVYFWNALPQQPPADAPDSLYDSNGNRVPAGYWYGRNDASWTLSLDNYYHMLQLTGSTGIITVNYSYARYGTGPNPVQQAAHLAADWVRYDNGRTQFWEIGNEDSGPWQAGFRINTLANQDGQPEIISGALYGSHFKVFADSMRAAASALGYTIRIGAQMVQYEASHSWNLPDRDWNSGFFASAGNAADFFIVHSYYTPFNENSSAAEILSTAAGETASMVNVVRGSCQDAGTILKPMALTEWNIAAVGSRQAVSHINGLHADLVLGELIRNGYGMASRWDLANGWDNGNDHGSFSQGDEPDGIPRWTARPSYYHMYFFQRIFGDRMVKSTVSGSSSVQAFASTYSSGELGLVLVNTGTTAQTAKLAYTHFVPGNRYYWYTLTGGTDNTEFSRQVLVNAVGPGQPAGGPPQPETLEAASAEANYDVRLSLPPRSACFVLIEKSNITAVTDIDPNNRLVQVLPNPAAPGEARLWLKGFSAAEHIQVSISNPAGQMVWRKEFIGESSLHLTNILHPGIYFICVRTSRGITTKKLLVGSP